VEVISSTTSKEAVARFVIAQALPRYFTAAWHMVSMPIHGAWRYIVFKRRQIV
jgi:hypothetical protein